MGNRGTERERENHRDRDPNNPSRSHRTELAEPSARARALLRAIFLLSSPFKDPLSILDRTTDRTDLSFRKLSRLLVARGSFHLVTFPRLFFTLLDQER